MVFNTEKYTIYLHVDVFSFSALRSKLQSGYALTAFLVIDKTKHSISMVDSTKVLCPLNDEIDIFIPGGKMT